ncbi:hypothetical protein GCM10027055_18290 [Janibacter alkaliphilus]|uniref:DUF3017 domain-containing protein n=1 Tax=Janibacter alkaliphilus TaxID=1069963 RepID=A0A852X357_9MICO|nr:hypothetical protein [Janibacter alkaliphilus]
MEIDETPTVTVESRPRVARGLGAWWLVAALVLLGVGVAIDRMLWASVIVSGGLALGALLRLTLPEERAGGLVVRARAVDVATLLVLGLAVLVSGLSLDLTPR